MLWKTVVMLTTSTLQVNTDSEDRTVLTGRTISDELQILRYGTAGVNVTVIHTVQVLFDQWQHARKLTWL